MTVRIRKQRIVTWCQRTMLTPWMRAMVWAALIPGHVIVETTGRRTGKRRRAVVGAERQGDEVWVIAEFGRRAGWVANLVTDPRVRVRHRLRWHDATADVLDHDDAGARLDAWGRPIHARLVRRLGTDPTTVRVTLSARDAPIRPTRARPATPRGGRASSAGWGRRCGRR